VQIFKISNEAGGFFLAGVDRPDNTMNTLLDGQTIGPKPTVL
jgi:hypothetical protein